MCIYKGFILSFAFLVAAPTCAARSEDDPGKGFIENQKTWNDTAGKPIAAHDGGISRFGDKFYWYGNSYAGNPKGKYGIVAGEIWNGVQCYSSSDLVHWTNEGAALPRPKRGWCKTATCARPKVLYNTKTGKYVMWYAWYIHGPSSFITVAIAETPRASK